LLNEFGQFLFVVNLAVFLLLDVAALCLALVTEARVDGSSKLAILALALLSLLGTLFFGSFLL
jgi:hypothetical protein